MIPDSILRALKPEQGAAKGCWIRPDGSVLPCPLLRHFEVLGPEIVERHNALLQAAEEDTARWLESLDPDEHIEWHLVDEAGDAARRLMEELSSEGYIRCGFWNQVNGATILEMDTILATARKHRELLGYITAALGIEKLYLTDQGAYSYKRKLYRGADKL